MINLAVIHLIKTDNVVIHVQNLKIGIIIDPRIVRPPYGSLAASRPTFSSF